MPFTAVTMILQIFHISSLACMAGAIRRDDTNVAVVPSDSMQYAILPHTATIVSFNKTIRVGSSDGERQPRNALTPELSPAALVDLSLDGPVFPPGNLVSSEGSKTQVVFNAPEKSGMPSFRGTLLKQIGKGGYSFVYSCRLEIPNGTQEIPLELPAPGEILAVKFITRSKNITESAREYEMAQRIQSRGRGDHAVKTFAVFQLAETYSPFHGKYGDGTVITKVPKGTMVVVMELVPKQLYEIRPAVRSWGEDWIWYIWFQVLDGVRAVHEVGLMWRDIKPENVLCTSRQKDMVVKISDFGMTVEAPCTNEETPCGTPEYMAPELYERRDNKVTSYDEQIDVWGLGILLYELLYGETPFDATYPIDIESKVRKFRNNELTFPTSPPVSKECKYIILKLLQKKPLQRPRVVPDTNPRSQGLLIHDPVLKAVLIRLRKKDGMRELNSIFLDEVPLGEPAELVEVDKSLLSASPVLRDAARHPGIEDEDEPTKPQEGSKMDSPRRDNGSLWCGGKGCW